MKRSASKTDDNGSFERMLEFAISKSTKTIQNVVHTIMTAAIELQSAGHECDALDLVFDMFEDFVISGAFGACDTALEQLDVTKPSEEILLTILTATLPAHHKLSNRASFYNKVERELRRREHSDNEVNEMLDGLEGYREEDS
jgi:hypothetical protein